MIESDHETSSLEINNSINFTNTDMILKKKNYFEIFERKKVKENSRYIYLIEMCNVPNGSM